MFESQFPQYLPLRAIVRNRQDDAEKHLAQCLPVVNASGTVAPVYQGIGFGDSQQHGLETLAGRKSLLDEQQALSAPLCLMRLYRFLLKFHL